MGRWGWVVAATCALSGFALGRGVGPARVEFPSADVARDAARMEREVADALAEPRAFPRASRLIRLFEGLSSENADGAARAVDARTGEYDPVDLQLFLTAWAHLDPTAAIAEVQTWPIQARRNFGLRTLIREWAASGHPLEAGAFYDSLTDPEQRNVAAGPLVRGWALSGDVDGAVGLARRFWETDGRRDVFDPLVRGVLHVRGATGTLEVARTLMRDAPPAFAQPYARVALNLAGREDPVAAAAYYDELVRSGPQPWLAGSMTRLAGLLRNSDPQAALEWLLPQAEGRERLRALMETMGTWAIRDLDAAWAWLEGRSSAVLARQDAALSTTDAALLSGVVRRMARVRPEQAAPLSLRLTPQTDRVGMVRRVAYFWSMRDSEAAAAWVASLDLPASELDAARQAVEWGSQTAPVAGTDLAGEDREPDLPDDE